MATFATRPRFLPRLHRAEATHRVGRAGRLDNEETFHFPTSIEATEAMSWKQLSFLATTLTGESMDEENGVAAVIEANGSPR
jgi:hypothetical protein